MSVEAALQALRLDPRFMRNVVAWRRVPARPAQYAAFPDGLDARLRAALAEHHVEALYTHQAEAVAAALAGEDVAVVTPAASGKTLCYNLPVLQRLLAEPQARALYLYPTKALAQDQLAELRGLASGLPDSPLSFSLPIAAAAAAAVYDGDTPSSQRPKIRETARVVLSNPDMLHAGILPQHTRWAGFFAGLRFVVIDEMHVYRGVFGSHVANVLRRLRRICRFYGSHPQFILASATIANPGALAERLVEAPVTVIGEAANGAPQAEKEILFYNPPLLDPALGIRRSSSLEAADLAAHFLAHGVQTIVFARARLTTELVLTGLREALAGEVGSVPGRPATGLPPVHAGHAVRGYRGGYLPNERREIEAGLREGSVRGVVATNALELGIDIGRLDAAVLAGYPGTVASARQQIGRAGRRLGVSAAVLVATAAPLDQYILAHPEYLLGSSPEHALLNPDNELILAGHLACAAAELPIEAGETFGAASLTAAQPGRATSARTPMGIRPELLDDMVEAGQLYRANNRFFWAGEGSPSAAISLRAGSPDRVVIQVMSGEGKPQVIGEMDRPSVPLMLYEGAVYLHEGTSYLVERLDWDAGIAYVRPADVDFYTRPSIGETVEVLAVHASAPVTASPLVTAPDPASSVEHPAAASWGDVRVVSRASGYRVIHRGTNEVLGFGQIDLPEQVLETQACWLEFPPEMIEELKAAGAWFSDPNDYGPEWPARRDAARARDGYRCQACGAVEPPARQHDVHHRVPFRAFVADPTLRQGLPAELAWQAANRPENLVTLCADCHHRAEAGVRIRSGLGGMAALLAGVAPLCLMCDVRDLGVIAEPQHPVTGLPTITVYEKTPGGVGYAEELHTSMPELLQAALDLVSGCPCERGCPSCVGPVLEHEYALDAKRLAAALLRACGATGAA